MGISKNSIRTSLRGRYLPTGQAGDRSNLNIKAYCIRLLPISFLMVRNDDEVFRGAHKYINEFTGKYNESIDISNFSEGVYFLHINTDKGNISSKVIIE